MEGGPGSTLACFKKETCISSFCTVSNLDVTRCTESTEDLVLIIQNINYHPHTFKSTKTLQTWTKTFDLPDGSHCSGVQANCAPPHHLYY